MELLIKKGGTFCLAPEAYVMLQAGFMVSDPFRSRIIALANTGCIGFEALRNDRHESVYSDAMFRTIHINKERTT